MRPRVKMALAGAIMFALLGVFLFLSGVISTPRNFASPPATIRVLGPNDVPVAGLEVSRNWYDSDTGMNGEDEAVHDPSGNYTFAKIPAHVGLFTGAWRKFYSFFGMCSSGSGASTTIYLRFPGSVIVLPQDKPLYPNGQALRGSNGIWFNSSLDANSNTLVSLAFPPQTKNIHYLLPSKPQGNAGNAPSRP